ncbi:uncharacterized protein LOC143032116 [Oratosquilla oratoria]|uniref:uncharacterized protein LOC143032116 n=1 Tax=Oratosquilla oratoria TaxID=337810 RepID=UPI003F75EB87
MDGMRPWLLALLLVAHAAALDQSATTSFATTETTSESGITQTSGVTTSVTTEDRGDETTPGQEGPEGGSGGGSEGEGKGEGDDGGGEGGGGGGGGGGDGEGGGGVKRATTPESPPTTTTSPVSQRSEDPVWEIRHLLPEAKMENNSVVDVTVQVGTTALLPCKFRSLAEQQVSWFRRRDWHILTTGVFTYTTDQRFTVLHPRDSEDWTLQIKYTTIRDNGTYECQLSTGTGVTSQFVNMRVVQPLAVILSGDLHVQRGSTIRLECTIKQQSPNPSSYIFWYHDYNMLNYDTRRGGINVTTRPGPRETYSILTVSDAREADSGNYTCSAPNTRPASVSVFVYDGDNTAAIQRRKSGARSVFQTTQHLLLLVFSASVVTALASALTSPSGRSPSSPLTLIASNTTASSSSDSSTITKDAPLTLSATGAWRLARRPSIRTSSWTTPKRTAGPITSSSLHYVCSDWLR